MTHIIECNAKIISSSIYLDGRLTFLIKLDSAGGITTIGSYNLSPYQSDDWEPDFCYFVERVLQLAESPSWEDLPSKIIKIRVKDGIVTHIGNAIRDDWICIIGTLYPDHIKELGEVL